MLSLGTMAKDDLEVIPTGLPQLDRLLGTGGYPRKYLTMISGDGGVGKTTIAIQGIKEAQKRGIKVLYVETDYKFVPSYFKSMGVVLDNLKVIQGEVGEDVLHDLVEAASTGKYGLLVLDTVSKITPREEVEKDFDSATIGKQAMLIGRFLRKLKPLANAHNMAVVLLNHERQNIMTQGINTPGGKAIQEDVIVWVRMSHTGEYLKQGGVVIGKRIKAKIWRKNQVAPTEGHETILEVFNGRGFSAVSDIVQDALDKGIITKQGNTFYFGEQKIAVGAGKTREEIENNEVLLEEISVKIKEL